MTDTTDLVTITIMRSGVTVPSIDDGKFSENRVALKGEVLHFTPEQVDSTRDLLGNSWLEMSEEAQMERWGHLNFKIGDHSAELGVDYLGIGSDDERIMFLRQEQAILAAQKISDPRARQDALKSIRKKFGTPASSQRTLREY